MTAKRKKTEASNPGTQAKSAARPKTAAKLLSDQMSPFQIGLFRFISGFGNISCLRTTVR